MQKTTEIIIAGFGGQGVLSMGQTIAYSAMQDSLETSWMPSYGPEMRGGTANCTVIVSDGRISSPLVSRYDVGIVLNQPSLDKFEKLIKPGGLLMFEDSTVVHPPTREDITILRIAAAEEASRMEKKQIANMIMLGAFLKVRPIVSTDAVLKALTKVLPERHHHLIPLNEQALKRGAELVIQQLEHV